MRRFRIFYVSVYLFCVALYLLATKRIKASGLKKVFKSAFRSKYKGSISNFKQEIGYCWKVGIPEYLCSDADSASKLFVFENGVKIGAPHSSHEEIRKIGLGRYSHWGGDLYFSTPDNTNPNTNGKTYSVEEL